MVTHAYNSSIREVEAGGEKVQGYPLLLREFEVSLGYTDPVSKINPPINFV